MDVRRVVTWILLVSTISAVFLAAVDPGLCEHPWAASSATYTPLGPKETTSFEIALNKLRANVYGIWPRPEFLADAERPSDYWLEFNKKWLARVLKEDVQPKDGNWNSDKWIMVPELRPVDNDFILGKFSSASDKLVGEIEFQASDRAITLVFHSPILFGRTDLDDSAIRQIVTKPLNVPSEYIDELKIEHHSAAIGDDKTPICYGTVSWKWDPARANSADSLNYNKERRWWTHMRFWIALDRLCIDVSTVDWQGLGPSGLGQSILNSQHPRSHSFTPNEPIVTVPASTPQKPR